ncbi:hypothetical protein QTG54_005531 [Skeletonema marinoi]|uniref:Uncharacterized protein n=1 Tax=Skeletonema marinoi TaxID=267567 RepID=A0AAD8YCJ7_9STRA|nr:hypothetical protein QTG54_005531 [Skeletonema marinoi]
METEPVEESRDVSFDANMTLKPGLPEERIPLPTTSDGWFVAAPKSRKAYRKAIDDTEAENPLVAAETQKVSGLVVRAYVKPAATARPGRSVRRGKDFKRFRKNTSFVDFLPPSPSMLTTTQAATMHFANHSFDICSTQRVGTSASA